MTDTTTATQGGRKARLEREGEVAADFLETLLDIADLDGDIDLDIDGDRAAVAIVDSEEGRVPRRLVGQDGRVLEALQELTRLAVQSATGERSRLMLDVAGHRAERRSELVTVAQGAVERVRESGEPESLEPMSAFERKIVHDEVLAAGLGSESSGTEPRRYVVVLPGAAGTDGQDGADAVDMSGSAGAGVSAAGAELDGGPETGGGAPTSAQSTEPPSGEDTSDDTASEGLGDAVDSGVVDGAADESAAHGMTSGAREAGEDAGS